MKEIIVLIEAGCADCHSGDEPLITMHQFESVKDANEWANKQRWATYGDPPEPIVWEPHPQGGDHVVVGQGSLWIMPGTYEAREEKK